MPSNRQNVENDVKKQEIRGSARKMFLAFGYEKTSLAKIAKQAGVTPNTIYWYFDSKEALFASVVEEIINAFLTAFDTRKGESLRGNILWVISVLEASRAFIVTIHEKSRTSEVIANVHQRFHDSLAEISEVYLLEKGMQPAEIKPYITLVSFVVEGILMHELEEKEKNDIVSLLTTHFRHEGSDALNKAE